MLVSRTPNLASRRRKWSTWLVVLAAAATSAALLATLFLARTGTRANSGVLALSDGETARALSGRNGRGGGSGTGDGEVSGGKAAGGCRVEGEAQATVEEPCHASKGPARAATSSQGSSGAAAGEAGGAPSSPPPSARALGALADLTAPKDPGDAAPVRRYGVRFLAQFPHDPGAFTQGLEVYNKCPKPKGIGGTGAASGGREGGEGADEPRRRCTPVLWESTGLHGSSRLREVELETGRVLRERWLGKSDFGEGLTILGGAIFQLAWRSPRMWRWTPDLDAVSPGAGEDGGRALSSDIPAPVALPNPLGNGWGLANDGRRLVAGDATDKLAWLDPASGKEMRSVRVTDAGGPVVWLNELEYVDGTILANVWSRECVAAVDPASGAVTAWVDFRGVRKRMLRDAQAAGRPAPRSADVLNGIAYDPLTRRLFITGKHWPILYEVELVRLADDPEELELLRGHCIIRSTNGFV